MVTYVHIEYFKNFKKNRSPCGTEKSVVLRGLTSSREKKRYEKKITDLPNFFGVANILVTFQRKIKRE